MCLSWSWIDEIYLNVETTWLSSLALPDGSEDKTEDNAPLGYLPWLEVFEFLRLQQSTSQQGFSQY